MATYCKQIDASGSIVALLTYNFQPQITNPLVVEITKDEYDAHSAEIEIANRVKIDPDEISDTEALQIILGGEA